MSFEALGFDGLDRMLRELTDIDDMAPEILNAAAPILEEQLQSQIQVEANRGYATGVLKKSVTANRPRKNSYGYYVSVTAKGKDGDGIRNNEKLAYLHYGTSKQSARPVITKAVRNCEQSCRDAMQQKFDEVTQT